MNDQPNPTTGKWTVETVDDLLDYKRRNSKAVADAHNAQIAAEKTNYDLLSDDYRAIADSNLQLRAQLAAARGEEKAAQAAYGMVCEQYKPLVDALTKISNGFTPADTIAKVALKKVGKQ